MTTDNTDDGDFSDQPIEEWFIGPADSPLTDIEATSSEPPPEGAKPSRRRSRRKIALSGLIALALFAAGTAVGLLLGSRWHDADVATDITPSAPDGSSPADSPKFPTLGMFDSFSRMDSDQLGFTESGGEWTEVTGDWGIESGSALVRRPKPGAPSVAIANTKATSNLVQVSMPSVDAGAGLVFRYANQFNYWTMTAAPTYGTWSISQVSDGKSVVIQSVGLAPVGDNTTIAVRSDESSIEFFVNGKRVGARKYATDTPNATYAGLIDLRPNSMDARWTHFVAISLDET